MYETVGSITYLENVFIYNITFQNQYQSKKKH